MNKPLIFTTALVFAALVAGAAVDVGNLQPGRLIVVRVEEARK